MDRFLWLGVRLEVFPHFCRRTTENEHSSVCVIDSKIISLQYNTVNRKQKHTIKTDKYNTISEEFESIVECQKEIIALTKHFFITKSFLTNKRFKTPFSLNFLLTFFTKLLRQRYSENCTQRNNFKVDDKLNDGKMINMQILGDNDTKYVTQDHTFIVCKEIRLFKAVVHCHCYIFLTLYVFTGNQLVTFWGSNGVSTISGMELGLREYCRRGVYDTIILTTLSANNQDSNKGKRFSEETGKVIVYSSSVYLRA